MIIKNNKGQVYLFGSLAGLIQVPSPVQRPLHQLVPASLDTQQEVLDEHHILFEAGKAQLRSCLLQSQHLLPVCVHLIYKHLRNTQQQANSQGWVNIYRS